MNHAEFVIRGATIVDGTGADEFKADVLVRDGQIASIGEIDAGIARTVDGDGMFLAPGFVDCHCHDDLEMLQSPDRLEKIAQGVTTVVVGNCGFSLYPCTPESRDLLRGHAGGLLGKVGAGEVFEDIASYSDRLISQGIGINFASLVGHGPLRLEVLGFESRPATRDERDAMCKRLETQLLSGATGLSLGLVYPPSAFADTEELVALCKVTAQCGKPVAAHIRSYEAGLLDATHEFLNLLRRSGAQGVLSHLQAAGRPNWGSVGKALEVLDQAASEGVRVSFDMYPYLAGSSYALQLLPPSASSGGIKVLKQKLKSPAERAALKARLAHSKIDSGGWQSKVSVIGWESILIASTEKQSLKELEGKTILEAADDANCDPFDVLERLILEEDGATAVILFQLAEADLRKVYSHPSLMVGSDGIPRREGRPHARAFGAFPRVIHQFSQKDQWFTRAEAVRRMTSLPAKEFGLGNRGVIKPGAVADLVLFTPEFRDLASYEHPRRLAVGANHVWVAGTAVLVDGEPTGLRPGNVLG